jgi:hypothetical protein
LDCSLSSCSFVQDSWSSHIANLYLFPLLDVIRSATVSAVPPVRSRDMHRLRPWCLGGLLCVEQKRDSDSMVCHGPDRHVASLFPLDSSS